MRRKENELCNTLDDGIYTHSSSFFRHNRALCPSSHVPKIKPLHASISAPSLPTRADLNGDFRPGESGVLDAELSVHRTRLLYGCSVVLEHDNGNVLLVRGPVGEFVLEPMNSISREAIHASGTIPSSSRHRASPVFEKVTFRLLDMNNARNTSSIKYGDAVWLQITSGTGESSWEQGGIVGVHVHKVSALTTLTDNQGNPRIRRMSSAVVGRPIPLKAHLPKVSFSQYRHELEGIDVRFAGSRGY